MLVYLKSPMGYTQIGPYRIYGRKFAHGIFGHTNVPKKIYDKNKDILDEADYSQEWLEEKFGNVFPDISFKLSKLHSLTNKQLIDIARGIGINYINKNNKLNRKERYGICRSIYSTLKDKNV